MHPSSVRAVIWRRRTVVRFLVVATLFGMVNSRLAGAASVLSKIACGHHAQGEFTESDQQHSYEIGLEAGTKLNVRIVPYGKVLRVRSLVYDPVDVRVADTRHLSTEVTFDAGPLSANGVHKIMVQNYRFEGDEDSAVGLYDIYIKCVDRGGQIIEAGSVGGGGVSAAPAPAGAVPGGQGNPIGNGLDALDQTLGRVSQSPEMSKYQKDVEEARSYARIAKEAAGVAQVFSNMFRGRKKRRQQEAEIERLRAQVQLQQSGQVQPGQPIAQPIYQGPGRQASTGAVQAPPMQAAPMVARSFGPQHVAGMVFAPMSLGSVLEGQVSPAGDVAGSRFTLPSATRVTLGFERIAGDLHLDLLVLDGGEKTVFDARLRANPHINTVLDLSAGAYTVAIRAADPGTSAGATRFRLHFGSDSTSLGDNTRPIQGNSMVPVTPHDSGRLAAMDAADRPNGPALAATRHEASGVTLFGRGQFTGAYTHYDRDQVDLQGTPVADDGVASVRLSPGCLALLYSQPSFAGPATMLETDAAILRPLTRVHSLRVRCE